MSLEDKHELYQEHLRRPHTHYSELANWAKITFNLSTTPAKSTICNAIKRNHTKSQRVDAKARTMDRNVALPQVEAKIVEWVLRCEELGVCITGELIRKQATTIAIELAIPETQRIKFAKGWLYKFQRKHGFRSMIQHGEAASVPPEQVQEGRKKGMLKLKLLHLGLEGSDDSSILRLQDFLATFLDLLGRDRSGLAMLYHAAEAVLPLELVEPAFCELDALRLRYCELDGIRCCLFAD
ncbi:hypothetical protein DYB26_016303 [Aphanomyces astaci]|uniref:HTH CENPB-type domain-containing protein n=1 Tax=Aphanomyces astaci TaxID=112090 RepID=A0A3R7A370_APHAT|nr:hypothetical protein DYB26_016303 [Aphanomyces astaci]